MQRSKKPTVDYTIKSPSERKGAVSSVLSQLRESGVPKMGDELTRDIKDPTDSYYKNKPEQYVWNDRKGMWEEQDDLMLASAEPMA